MARSLNSRCNFDNGFFTCNLPEDAVLLVVKVKTKTGNHTLVEDAEKRTKNLDHGRILLKIGKTSPKKLPGVLSPRKNDNSMTEGPLNMYKKSVKHTVTQRHCPTPQTIPTYIAMNVTTVPAKPYQMEIWGILLDKRRTPHGWPACLKKQPPRVAFRNNDIYMVNDEESDPYKEPQE